MSYSIIQYLKELYNYSKNKLVWLTAGLLASSTLEGISLLLIIPFLQAAGISGTSSTINTHPYSQSSHYMLMILLLYLVFVIGQEFFRRYTTISTISIKAGFNKELSDKFYEAFARAKWMAILKQRRSDIANALTNELKTIDMGTMVLVQTLTTLPSALMSLIISFIISPAVTLAAIFTGILFFICMRPVNRRLGNLADSLNNVLKDSLSDINDHLGGIKEIKGYGAEQAHLERYTLKTRDTEKKFVQFVSTYSTSNFVFNTATILILAAFIYCAVTFFHVDIAKLVVLSIIFFRIWPLLGSFQSSFQFFLLMIPAWESFLKRMEELAAAREDFEEASHGETIEIKKGIEIKDVSFSYGEHIENGEPALKNVSISIPAHSLIAVTGKSGSGKSTLIDILLGLLQPQSGEIAIDGEPFRPEMTARWRNTIGFVPQDNYLFNGTVRENLMWARPNATEDELWEALEMSAADEFIREIPEGLETSCGDRGSRFSGGQRQRIALARAILRKPSLLILDEATSSLDTENEKKIQSAIRQLRGRMTILIVAHRMTTIKDADEIVLLEDGVLKEKGSFTELIEKNNGIFHELAKEYTMN
ncbi:MAG: ABC transporter ATP-binding protein [Vulcanimicrobiota bacterium]